MRYRIKNWDQYQQVKTRRAPWFKLYGSLFSSRCWIMATTAQQALMIACLDAGRAGQGEFDGDPEFFQAKYYLKEPVDMQYLVDHDFIEPIDSNEQSCKQVVNKTITSCNPTDNELVTTRNSTSLSLSLSPSLNKEIKEKLMVEWNQMAQDAGAATVRVWGDDLSKTLSTRLKDVVWRDSWLEALLLIPKHPFLCGKVADNKGKTFRANMEWFLRKGTVTSLINGKYDRDSEKKDLSYG